MDEKKLEVSDEQEEQKQQEAEAANKTAHVAGKAAATYFGGNVGAKAYDKLSQTKLGKNLENQIGKKIQKNRQANRMAQKLNNSGALDAADKAIDAASGNGTGGSGGNSSSLSLSSVSNLGKKSSNSSTKDKGLITIPNMKKAAIKVLIIAIPTAIFLLLAVFLITIAIEGNEKGIAMNGYYAMRCPEVTVVFTDKQNNYEVTDIKTYPLEEYVAGVVAGEVGFLGSTEVDKAFAIAARSYFFANESNCTIESSDRKQVFRELTTTQTDKLAIEATEATKGKVLLKDNNLYSTQYDAFACIEKDDNYYTISQAEQKIPITWLESKINPSSIPDWFICNGSENLKNHHGNGLSQYGSLYLAEEKGYTYEEILAFYLGKEDITISSGFLTSIAGLEVKNTTSATNLDRPLGELLNENGASIEDMNAFIKESVESVGKGTRAGVVAAAVSQINYLYDNFNVNIPYYWGGAYIGYGVYDSLGAITSGSTSNSGKTYIRKGFDCSGFVSWAIKNGGYKFGRYTTRGFHNAFSGDSCNITDQNCIGQPGDLINSQTCHVQMIVAVDETSGKYMIAESTGSMGVVMHEWNMHSQNCGRSNETRILHMDSFYDNPNNVDPNY